MDKSPQSAPDLKPNFFDASMVRLTGGSYLPALKFVRLHDLIDGYAKEREGPSDPVKLYDFLMKIMDLLELPVTEQGLFVDFNNAVRSNPKPPKLAWQQKPLEEQKKEEHEDIILKNRVDFPGRYLANMVAIISSEFSWTADYILHTLTYYEVCIYYQEALLREHERHEWEYTLASDIGVEKRGSDYIKKPFPKPGWMGVEAVRVRKPGKPLPIRFRPTGVIVDYANDPRGVSYYVPPEEENVSNSTEGQAKDNRSFGETP